MNRLVNTNRMKFNLMLVSTLLVVIVILVSCSGGVHKQENSRVNNETNTVDCVDCKDCVGSSVLGRFTAYEAVLYDVLDAEGSYRDRSLDLDHIAIPKTIPNGRSRASLVVYMVFQKDGNTEIEEIKGDTFLKWQYKVKGKIKLGMMMRLCYNELGQLMNITEL